MDLSRYKVVGGAMSWISDANLVSALANSGALGFLATGAMKPDELDTALKEIKSKTSEPFGVNLIGISPYYNELLQICADHKVEIIAIAAMIPRREKIDAVKAIGARVIGFAASLKIATDMIKNGIDALVLEGNEAGGHVGSIALSVLIQEILLNLSGVPIFVAGGIGDGRMAKFYMNMGATGCQFGTRFVCAHESPMHPKTKEFYISKQAKDTIVVGPLDPAFSVIPVRVLKNSAVQEFFAKQLDAIELMRNGSINATEAQMMIEHFWSGSLKRGVIEGDLERGSLMCGQSVSFVTKCQSVREIIDEIQEQMGQIH